MFPRRFRHYATGPLARDVVDAAAMLQAMAAADPADPQTADNPHQDYLAALDADALVSRLKFIRDYEVD